jgi:hypothetical protein
MRWGDGAARRAVHAVIRRERAKCAGLPSEEREKGPNRAVGEKANQRLCDAQAAGARPAPDVATFTEVTRPSTVEGQHVPPALRRTTGDGGDVRHRRGSPTCSPASTTPPWDGSSAPCSIGPTQSAGHLRPASAQTQRPHRSAMLSGQRRYQFTPQGRLAVLFTKTYGRVRGPVLPRLTHAYLRNWFDEVRWPSPGANSTAH